MAGRGSKLDRNLVEGRAGRDLIGHLPRRAEADQIASVAAHRAARSPGIDPAAFDENEVVRAEQVVELGGAWKLKVTGILNLRPELCEADRGGVRRGMRHGTDRVCV